MQCPRCANEVFTGAKFCLECGSSLADPGADTMFIDQDESMIVLRSLQRSLAGEFAVEREIGRGAMAIVYKATENELNRTVALKVLPPSAPVSKSVAERFKREARLAASLDHPNIIPVYRVGQAGSTHFIAMKYVDGRGLDEILESQGPLPIPVVLHVIRSAISALAYAHRQGIVHRDVKGGNIMVDRDGRVMVTDFGIARAMEDASLTATGSVVGTPFYMSPEQCAAKRIGPQSDQYSLGVVAFQMLTGFVPFNAETLPGIMHHHFYTPVPDLTASRHGVPAALMTIINRALSKKPDHRYATTEAMLEAIDAVPFSAEERRQGEDDLRTLARGGLLLRINAGPLPAMLDPTRGTPTGSVPVLVANAAPPRVSRTLTAAAIVTAVVALGWAGMSYRTSAALATATGASARSAPPVLPNGTGGESLSAGGATAASATRAASTAAMPPTRRQDSAAAAIAPAAAVSIAPAAPGLIRARAYPVDAEIFVDGQSLGRGVVLDARVPAGRRRLRVRAPGYADFDTIIVVAAGETSQIPRITLKPKELAP
jgi:tRNA A-37 threonylcarbamoyl transferase component Bud32